MSFDTVPDLAPPVSRLPQVGTTIFTVMSALAQEAGAINLGQGFPDFPCDPALVDAVTQAMRDGLNQYPPMTGVPALRRAVAGKIAAVHGRHYDPDTEITITAGATQALLTSILALVHPGDEVVVFEPCYDSYAPAVELAGGVLVRVPPSAGGQRPDLARAAEFITPRTRMVVVNSPHNPSGTVWRAADLDTLAAALRGTRALLLSDEVYEHMVFDGQPHLSASGHAELAPRSVVVSSFGKTFHVTGWKVGYVAAPAALTAEFRKVHQFNVFTVNTPVQHALARYLGDPSPWRDLPAFYQRKRDLFRDALAGSRFTLLPSEGSYFQCVDYRAIADEPDEAFCRRLIREAGVAAIPLSAFSTLGDPSARIVRLCFAKQDDTLRQAAERLRAL
jgi:methionine transaminase